MTRATADRPGMDQ